MGQTLIDIAQTLKDADKKVQLIYAFNGSGSTKSKYWRYYLSIGS